ncbi:amidohydrolase family protein [Microlunatus speluncae]|uniref:amidohydrolase family protein n=1 Tax=Microlunatus speluncae TaxID=2594267 RepID=UPI0012666DEC|nr:amidohydrolase family protein [Microlunatus speluncae]
MIIDAHQHFWRLAEAEQPWRRDSHHRIARDYLPDDLITAAAGTPVEGTVLVESVDGPAENDRLAVFAEHPLVLGVVAWLPLSDPVAARRELDRITSPDSFPGPDDGQPDRSLSLSKRRPEPVEGGSPDHPGPVEDQEGSRHAPIGSAVITKLAGVRCLIGADPIEWTRDPAVRELFADLADRGLAWDVVPVTADQCAAVIELAAAVPGLKIVLDHLARPPIESAGWQPWADQVARLADIPSVAIKLSIGLDALSAWDSWRADALPRYVEWAIRRFGPERCLLASNWPVVELRAPYTQAWHNVAAAAAACCDPAGLAEISGGTARRWYGLP